MRLLRYFFSMAQPSPPVQEGLSRKIASSILMPSVFRLPPAGLLRSLARWNRDLYSFLERKVDLRFRRNLQLVALLEGLSCDTCTGANAGTNRCSLPAPGDRTNRRSYCCADAHSFGGLLAL